MNHVICNLVQMTIYKHCPSNKYQTSSLLATVVSLETASFNQLLPNLASLISSINGAKLSNDPSEIQYPAELFLSSQCITATQLFSVQSISSLWINSVCKSVSCSKEKVHIFFTIKTNEFVRCNCLSFYMDHSTVDSSDTRTKY